MKVSDFGAILLFAAFAACSGGSNSHMSEQINASDVADSEAETTTCGVVLDQAMNSVLVLTLDGDSADFSYPELEPNRRCSCGTGDTITIKHVGDSVTLMLPGIKG